MRRHVSYSIGSCLLIKVDSEAVICPMALDFVSLIRRISTLSCVLCLQTSWESSDALRVMRLRILPPYGEDSHVANAHAYIFKTPDVTIIINIQDMRPGNIFNAYKTCEHAATVQCRLC
jgi:hypothetical protein